MEKIKKTITLHPHFAAVVAIGILALVGSVIAFNGNNNGTVIENQTVAGNYVVGSTDGLEPQFGTGIGDFVQLNEVEYGSALSARLNFAAGATSTPGGMFRILNGGSNKVCYEVVVDVSTGDNAGGVTGGGQQWALSVVTSTSPTAFRAGSTTLIGTTTFATGTTKFVSTETNGGTYSTQASSTAWEWARGEWLLGQFEVIDSLTSPFTTEDLASSTSYDGNAGRAFVRCHVRN